MSLRLQFWGTRGSVPSPGPYTVRYGGNTPCIELRTSGGWLVILDAGTGIRELGRSLIEQSSGAPVAGDIFLTHAHWDHIQGIPFFAPVFQKGNRFTIWSQRSEGASIEHVIRNQMSPVVFPVLFEQLDADVDFREISDGERHAGAGYEVTAMEVRHPGGALAFRFAEPRTRGGGLVYVSDNELGASEKYQTPSGWRERFTEFVRGAKVLVHDTTYTTDEYDFHRGWGHSTFRDATELAVQAGVETLVLFHHEPRRTDDELDRRLAECQALVRESGGGVQVIVAAEGLTLTI
ncbi:MAG: MBL fold metallo-hydrolase [Gemmatimonadaceae bacterium]|nr:MBL fold metallo-hydrolase [Gemmatimonadaceae bacterium]